MTRSRNPIAAIKEAVSPYVVTGEAASALERWKEVTPLLSAIENFDELQSALDRAARSNSVDPVLYAMLEQYDAGDDLACLVVLRAFAVPLHCAALDLRFRVRESLEECATAVLFGFFWALWSRRDTAVPGVTLVAEAKSEAEARLEPEGKPMPAGPAGRFAWLAVLLDELVVAAILVEDLFWIIRDELSRRRQARIAATHPWDVLCGRLCIDDVPLAPPLGSPMLETDRAWGFWGGRARRKE